MTPNKAKEVVKVYLSSEEKRQVETLAKTTGRSLSDLLKRSVLDPLPSADGKIYWLAVLGRRRSQTFQRQLAHLERQFTELINSLPMGEDVLKTRLIQSEQATFQTLMQQLNEHCADFNGILEDIQSSALNLPEASEKGDEPD